MTFPELVSFFFLQNIAIAPNFQHLIGRIVFKINNKINIDLIKEIYYLFFLLYFFINNQYFKVIFPFYHSYDNNKMNITSINARYFQDYLFIA